MHLSTANEASNFSANPIQLYHSPGCKFKYFVVFFSIFLHLCHCLCVLSSIYFGFHLSERWVGELVCISAAYQWCGRLSNLGLPWPHIAHGRSNQVLERADIQWGLYCCSVLFLLMPFQEPWVATSVCPNHHFNALHKIPLPSMAKSQLQSPCRLLGAGTSFSPGFRQVRSPSHCDLVCLARNYCAPRNTAWEQAAAQHKVGWLQFKIEDGIMKFLG